MADGVTIVPENTCFIVPPIKSNAAPCVGENGAGSISMPNRSSSTTPGPAVEGGVF
jgi:hypothetical protein